MNEGEGTVALQIVKQGNTNETIAILFQTMDVSASSSVGKFAW